MSGSHDHLHLISQAHLVGNCTRERDDPFHQTASQRHPLFPKKAAADSTGRCNTFRKYSGRCAIAECFAWSGIELVRDAIQIAL